MLLPPATRLRLLAAGRNPRVYSARHTARLVAAALSVSALLSVSARPLQAGTVHWRTAGGGIWNVAANWDTNTVPQSGDDVFNDLFNSLITLNSSATIGSFQSNSAYTINGGTLTGSKTLQASTVQVNSAFTVNNGTLNNLTINAGSGGQGVTFTGSSNVTNVIFNAGASFGAGAFAEVYSGSNVVNSTFAFAGGQARLHDGNAVLTIGSMGVMQGYGTINENGGGSTLTNNGTLNANTSGQTLVVAPSNIAGNGTFQATNGGTLSIGGLLKGSNISVLAAGGTVQINGGGLGGSIASSTGNGLSFTGNGGNYISNASVSNGATLTFGTGAFAEVYNGSNVMNGLLNMTGGRARLHDGNAVLTLGSLGVAQGYGTLDQNGPGATLTNNGTVSANTSGQTLRITPSNITGTGLFTASNGGILSIGGFLKGTNVQVSAPADAANGVVLVDGGGLGGSVLSSTGTGVSFSSNGGNSLNAATVNGNLTFSSGAFAEVYNSNSLNNGTATFAGGRARLHDGNAVLTIGSLGVVQGYGTLDQNGGGATLTNNGTINANDSTGQILRITPSTINVAGTLQASNGGVLSIGGQVVGSNAAIVADTGTVLLDGGGLSGSFASSTGTGITLSNNGGNNLTNAVINGNVTLSSGFAEVYSGGNKVTGTATLAGANLRLHDGNAVFTLDGGTLTGYGLINQNGPGATLTNYGTINASVSGQVLTLAPSYITGTGTYKATNNSVLSIGGALIGSNATVHADAGTVLIDGGGLNGTFAASTGTGVSFSSNGSNSIGNSAAAVINGNLTFGNGAFAEVYNSNSLNNGTATFAGGRARLHDGNAVLTIGSLGVVQGYGTLDQNGPGATLTNNGTVNANGVNGQVLRIAPSAINVTGTLQASNGGVLSIGGQVVGSNAAIVADTGTVLLDGGGLSGSFASSTGTGITLSGNGGNYLTNAIINGNVTLSSGFAEVYNGSNSVAGTATLAGAHLRLHDGNAVFTVNGGTLTGYGLIDQNGPGATLTNNGAITANNSTNLLTIAPSYITGTGTYKATNNSVLSIGGALIGSNATVHADAGTVLIDGGGLNGTFAASTGTGVSFSSNGSNSIGYNAAVVINGNLTFGAGAFAEVFNGGNSLDNGTATFAGGRARLHDGNAVLTIGSLGVAQGYGTLDQNGGGATLTNNGTINANVNAQTLIVAPSHITGSGTFEGSNGGVLAISSFLNGSGVRALADTGTVEFDGGGLGGSVASTTGSGFSFTSNSGNYISNATVGNGAALTFGTGAFAEVYNGGNVVNGLLNIAGGQARLHDGNAVLTIGNLGVAQGYGAINQNGGGATLTNNGTINANVSGKTLTIAPSSFANKGTAQTTTGATLTVSSATTNTGAINAAAASSIFLNAGATQTAGSTTVDGTLNTNGQTFSLKGGTLGGAGTIVGPVSNTGGTVNPGDTTGALALTGSYAQSGAGSLFVELGGATQGQTYDVFKVSGAATLGGALDVKLVNSFLPYIGETFDFMTYGSHAGVFSNLVSLDGYQYTVTYGAQVATIQVNSAPVPEASTVLSLAGLLGLCGLARVRSRRKAA